MKTVFYATYNLIMTISMSVFTFAKAYFLYTAAIAPAMGIMAYFRTAAVLVLLYIMLSFIFSKRAFLLKLMLHELLGTVILADLMYFSYFNTLPSAGELAMLNVLPDIWKSILDLFKPVYILFYADTILLTALHFLMKAKHSTAGAVKRKTSAFAFILAAFLLMDSLALSDINSYQAYDSFGLIHFHIKQTGEMLAAQGGIRSGTGFLKSLEELTGKDGAVPQNFGIAKGRNVIVIQVEALQNFVINRDYNGQEVTPFLNSLIADSSMYFERYYQHIAKGGTSDAEFVTLNSLYPSFTTPAFTRYADKELYGLPRILSEQGYYSIAFHGFKPEFWNRLNMYPAMGFNEFISGRDFKKDEVIGWGVSDQSFFKQSAAYLKVTKQPFYAFLVTLSSHHPYQVPARYSRIKLLSKHKDTLLGRYIQTINYTDAAIGQFISELKKQGLYDNSIIAVYGDHHAINANEAENKEMMSDLLEHSYEIDEMLNIPLIIHIPKGLTAKTYSITGGQMDFLPTMLNLLGIKDDKARLYGQDLCNAEQGYAASQYVALKGSFIDDSKVYIASADGVFEHGRAWDRNTRQPIELELCREGYEKAIHEIKDCEYLLSNDLLFRQPASASPPEADNDTSFFDAFKSNVRLLITAAVK